MPVSKLTKRTIDSLKPGSSRFTAWDTDVSGFGLRVTPADERTYVLKYRLGGKQRCVHDRPTRVAMDAR